MDEFRSFREFWPAYMGEHSKPETRYFHVAGTLGGLALFGLALYAHSWLLLMAALACGYGCAWYSHYKIEDNRPVTFRHPLWSFLGDLKLCLLVLTGEIGDEYDRVFTEDDRTKTAVPGPPTDTIH